MGFCSTTTVGGIGCAVGWNVGQLAKFVGDEGGSKVPKGRDAFGRPYRAFGWGDGDLVRWPRLSWEAPLAPGEGGPLWWGGGVWACWRGGGGGGVGVREEWGCWRWGTGGEGLLANGEGRGRGWAVVVPQRGEICRPDATRLGLGLKEGEP